MKREKLSMERICFTQSILLDSKTILIFSKFTCINIVMYKKF